VLVAVEAGLKAEGNLMFFFGEAKRYLNGDPVLKQLLSPLAIEVAISSSLSFFIGTYSKQFFDWLLQGVRAR